TRSRGSYALGMSGFLERLFGGGARGDSAGVPDQPARSARAPAAHFSRPDLEVHPGPPVPESDLPRCAIVILNLNGRHHLAPCFESLKALDYPRDRLEVILIDNASSDGSVEEMRAQHAWVKLVVNERNVGFSAGCNQGARLAERADVVVFL